MYASAYENKKFDGCVDRSFHPRMIKVELPVRVDFVGGWSDTPPWSLERAGCVLNMAINLEGSLPIGAIIETTETAGVSISDDAGNQLHVEDLTSISAPFESGDPFRLVKSALVVTGIIHDDILLSMGLLIRTWANVPRGSGLGTSSILAAAVVKGLLQITDGDDSNESVARLVLVLEQLMGTGGGWQDQIGGLYPGIKFTASFPGIPLRLQVIPLVASSADSRVAATLTCGIYWSSKYLSIFFSHFHKMFFEILKLYMCIGALLFIWWIRFLILRLA